LGIDHTEFNDMNIMYRIACVVVMIGITGVTALHAQNTDYATERAIE